MLRRDLRSTRSFVRREERLIEYEWNHYRTFLILIVIALTLESYITGTLQEFLIGLGQYEYVGAFFAGFFYTYGVTTPFALTVLYVLSGYMNPFAMGLVGAFGSVFGEYLIYGFAKSQSDVVCKKKNVRLIIRNKYVLMLSPLIAGIIIMSPLPDELAAAFLGVEKYDVKKFMALAFVFNFLGILAIAGLNSIF
jgi:hypothetical protein